MLLLGDVGLGLLLSVLAAAVEARRRGRRATELGNVVNLALASFGLAVLLVEGLLPGFWLVVTYALSGGTLEDHLLPGSSIGGLLRSLVIGLSISAYASIRAYVLLLVTRRHRR